MNKHLILLLAVGREVSLHIRNFRVLAREDSALLPKRQCAYQPPPSIAENI